MFDISDSIASTGRASDRHALSTVFGLFGRLLVRELDYDLVETLRREVVWNTVLSLGVVLDELRTDEWIDDLAADYCRTFLGPRGNVSLLQSVAVEGRLQGESVQSMQRFLKFVSVPEPGVMIDHLGYQLQTMSAILSTEVTREDTKAFGEISNTFFERHIVWGLVACQRAKEIASTRFYRTLAASTEALIEIGLD